MWRLSCRRCNVAFKHERLWLAQEAWREHSKDAHPEFRTHWTEVDREA